MLLEILFERDVLILEILQRLDASDLDVADLVGVNVVLESSSFIGDWRFKPLLNACECLVLVEPRASHATLAFDLTHLVVNGISSGLEFPIETVSQGFTPISPIRVTVKVLSPMFNLWSSLPFSSTISALLEEMR